MAGAVEEEKELPKSERGRGSRQSLVLELISSWGGFFFFNFFFTESFMHAHAIWASLNWAHVVL